ncbi:putative cytoplasm protein [Naematelia encephala]|uniref:Putative cytoplasm protein n=1 Tax=Naematelia encephala TaxID=71784 RepID=A0A1Y2AT98_9TREE|nr:putative cytoplasm protein [Naematelia encephala]
MGQPHHIVIIGAGIVGCSTAYFLVQNELLQEETTVTLVEGTEVAAGASGYAGGFLAKGAEWHRPETVDLSQVSFDLHRELAERYAGETKWGYRAIETYVSVHSSPAHLQNIDINLSLPKVQSPTHWLPHTSRVVPKGDMSSTAQCMPMFLTKHLCAETLRHPNAALVIGRAMAVTEKNGAITGVVVRREANGVTEAVTLPCDCLVLAAGPWLGKLATQLLGPEVGRSLDVSGSQAHSIVIKPKEDLTAHAVFAKIEMGGLPDENEPEVYCRPDGTIYMCGTAGPDPLPATADKIPVSHEALKKLHSEARALTPILWSENGAQVVMEQACYLPRPARGRPLVGKVKGIQGVWVGGGHDVWGIVQGPGTGKVISEMILGLETSADVTGLAP